MYRSKYMILYTFYCYLLIYTDSALPAERALHNSDKKCFLEGRNLKVHPIPVDLWHGMMA